MLQTKVNGIVGQCTYSECCINNLIGDLRAKASTAHIAISGILISGWTQLSYHTIRKLKGKQVFERALNIWTSAF